MYEDRREATILYKLGRPLPLSLSLSLAILLWNNPQAKGDEEQAISTPALGWMTSLPRETAGDVLSVSANPVSFDMRRSQRGSIITAVAQKMGCDAGI
mmetsp:Transcript_24285/g.52858  ORF Transcript_24285/g.52858 Transcript_24285/m.52858 type:complete len:98 (-) Transcript_24285:222-515(-)